MASTVNVPLFGAQPKGRVIGIAIGGFGVSAYMIYKYEKKAKASAAATNAAQAAASSGYGYGAAYGYGNGYYGYGQGITYGYGASGGFPAGYYGYGVPNPPSGPLPVAATTNAQWAQAAITQLQSDGFDPQALAGALGAYELGQPVSADQQNMIQAAIAVEGYPPVPGANGDPPGINVQGTTGGGTGGGQGGGGSPPPVTGGGSASLYWHADLKYFTINGRKVNEPSGNYNIGGRNYYWHSLLRYFTLNGKKATPPSGPATAA